MKKTFEKIMYFIILPFTLVAHFIKRKSKAALALLVAAVVIFSSMPLTAFAAEPQLTSESHYNRIVDVNTMDGWKEFFDLQNLSTVNAGGVWTDKSVFKDASVFDGKVQMNDPDRNFLTALSAIAANKEIVGYSSIPTDTVLVLDLSGSMSNSDSERDLIDAANSAIAKLLANNENNRVGVVLYSASSELGASTYNESVTRVLPIDRYTTGSDNVFLSLNGTRVSVDRDVVGTDANADLDNYKNFVGGTYIQAGLWEAMEMFKEMDTVIGDNNWQAGDNRMPILVLMSDGAPSTGTSYYDDVKNSRYTTGSFGQNTRYASNVGNGNEDYLVAGNAFLTQLTASYVINQIKAHYQQKDANVRSLFYTLGFNIGDKDVAESVMNPDKSTYTDSLWTSYNQLTSGSMSVRVKGRSNSTNYTDVSITKNSYVTNKSYVDQYFEAESGNLGSTFDKIVEEIMIQSRYYPTHLEGGNPDFAGYVEFEDVIGEYMEVKEIKGILLGDTLYDGHMMASKLFDNTSGGLGTIENPTNLGDEFIGSVKTRLKIDDTQTARDLVASAFRTGQLAYETDGSGNPVSWSNYIGWYADSEEAYVGFWDENSTVSAPQNAVYKIKSYGFLGETTGSIKNSDMMYMTIQVRTNIATGEQSVIWKIPAALVPMITYLVSLEGTSVDSARNIELSVENPLSISPIRLIFESGLRSDLNELNITRITDSKHISKDGITRQFWTNYFDISAPEHDDHITALAEFTPSKENERFYYTFDSAVHKKVGNDYVIVGNGETLNPLGEYYHRRYIFEDGNSSPIFEYEKMSESSIRAAVWDDDFETLTHQHIGAYVVPAGTPARELDMYNRQKDENDGIDTKSAHMIFHPYLTEHNNLFYVDMNLGNNGLLEVTPAQGIRLSKTIDVYETGTSKDFSFRITVHNADGTPYTGTANRYLSDINTVPTSAPTQIQFSSNGTYVTELSADQTVWITALPTGTQYTVEEISANEDYKILSVHVNGISTGDVADGTIASYYIDDVRFVNTAIGEGDLVIEKQVVDENGNTVQVNENISFQADVTLTDKSGDPVTGTFEASNAQGEISVDANGRFSVTLKAGEAFVVRGIPEETKYTVVESNIPAGFTFDASKSIMSGVVDIAANDRVLIVNTYNPIATDGENVSIEVTKAISGNRTDWINGESYSFKVEHVSTSRVIKKIGEFTIDKNDSDKKHSLKLSSEDYTEAGIYHYSIYEVAGNEKGITYDTVVRRFAVVVDDTDMDGDLEITSVDNEIGTTITKSGNNYLVKADFNNVYAPVDGATVEIDVVKKMDGNYRLNGFQFALYNSNPTTDNDAVEFMRSTVTDANGNAKFTLTYAPNLATVSGTVHTYYLAEIDTNNPNVEYSRAVYKVEVTHKDNGDGTTTATPVITSVSGGEFENGDPVFTNTFVPSQKAYVAFTAQKVIDGNRVLNANEFDFVIEALTPGAPMPAENTTVSNAANGAVMFDAIEFENVGTYKYKIYESQANKIGGFVYDERFYEVTVVVTDGGDAKLYTSVSKVLKESENESGRTLGADEIITFTNKYSATSANVTLSGEKILTGKKLVSRDFSFILIPLDTSNPMPSSDTVSNNANGEFEFGEITFTKAGEYKYTVTEKDEAKEGFTYDKSVYEVTVTVTDNSVGKLLAQVNIKKNNLSASAIVFRNTYTPEPFEFDIYTLFPATKQLDGRPLKEGEFEFVLMNATTGVQIGNTVKNDANGHIKFPAIQLPSEGEYHFRISEVIGNEKGISYDTAIFHIFIKLEMDDGGILFIKEQKLYKGTVVKENVGGVLTEVVHFDELATGVNIVFNNSYKADPAHVTLEATKFLSGRDLIDGEFKFDLHKTDDTFTYNDNTVVQDDVALSLNDDGTGNVSFMPMVFDTQGDYWYVIVEDESANGKGVTADNTAYKVKISVTDNHKGDLIAEIFVNGQPIVGKMSDTVKFHNHYKAATTEIVIIGTKKLKGKDIESEQFTFELYDSDNQKLETVTNDENGKFTFTAIPIDTAGVYEFIVKELNDGQENIKYDNSVYKVFATVTDNLDGTFKVEYSYADGNEPAANMIFVNSYNAPKPEPQPAPDNTPGGSTSPQTGDNTETWLLFALAFASGVAIFGTMLYLKKEKSTEK